MLDRLNIKSLSVCLLLLFSAPLAAQEESAPQKTQKTTPKIDEINLPILEALATPVLLEYDEATFLDVKVDLEQKFKIDILLDQTAKDDSLTEEDSLTFSNLRKLRLDTCLKLMLAEQNATITVQDGVLRVISLDVADVPEYFLIQVFDCRSLIDKLTENRMNEFVEDSDPPVRWEQKMIATESLIDTIKGTCVVDEWYDTNGEGTITAIEGLIVLSQTYYATQQVEKLLNQIESSLVPPNDE